MFAKTTCSSSIVLSISVVVVFSWLILMFIYFVDGHLTVLLPRSARSASSKCIKMVNIVTHVPIAKVNIVITSTYLL